MADYIFSFGKVSSGYTFPNEIVQTYKIPPKSAKKEFPETTTINNVNHAHNIESGMEFRSSRPVSDDVVIKFRRIFCE